MPPEKSTEERLDRLWKWAFGNGIRGADERMNAAETKLEDMRGTLQRLEIAENRRTMEERVAKRERRAFSYGMLVVLLVLSVGGIRFAMWLTDQMGSIQRLLGPGGP